jgi:uncharacterized membrane protein
MHSGSSPVEPAAEAISKSRIEAFSDGVIAVAITLLVLDLRVPEVEGTASLAARLGAQWPNYLAYAISFVAIGIIWINHHAMLRRLVGVDHSVLVLNVLLLLCIVALPFTTALIATYLDAAGGHLAAVIYAGSFLVTSLVFFGMQRHLLLHRPRLLRHPLTPGDRRSILARGAVAIPVYAVAAAGGLLTPYLTLGICMVMGLFYLLPAAAGRGTSPGRPADRA